MNKEEIKELLNKLDLEEWSTDLYKVPLSWCELYDIRDYINLLQQENKQLKEKYLNAVADYEYEKSKNNKAIELLYKLNIQLKDVLKTGIDIKEISDIEKILKEVK